MGCVVRHVNVCLLLFCLKNSYFEKLKFYHILIVMIKNKLNVRIQITEWVSGFLKPSNAYAY